MCLCSSSWRLTDEALQGTGRGTIGSRDLESAKCHKFWTPLLYTEVKRLKRLNCSHGYAGNRASQLGLEKDGWKARVGKPPSEAVQQPPLKAGGCTPTVPTPGTAHSSSNATVQRLSVDGGGIKQTILTLITVLVQ